MINPMKKNMSPWREGEISFEKNLPGTSIDFLGTRLAASPAGRCTTKQALLKQHIPIKVNHGMRKSRF